MSYDTYIENQAQEIDAQKQIVAEIITNFESGVYANGGRDTRGRGLNAAINAKHTAQEEMFKLSVGYDSTTRDYRNDKEGRTAMLEFTGTASDLGRALYDPEADPSGRDFADAFDPANYGNSRFNDQNLRDDLKKKGARTSLINTLYMGDNDVFTGLDTIDGMNILRDNIKGQLNQFYYRDKFHPKDIRQIKDKLHYDMYGKVQLLLHERLGITDKDFIKEVADTMKEVATESTLLRIFGNPRDADTTKPGFRKSEGFAHECINRLLGACAVDTTNAHGLGGVQKLQAVFDKHNGKNRKILNDIQALATQPGGYTGSSEQLLNLIGAKIAEHEKFGVVSQDSVKVLKELLERSRGKEVTDIIADIRYTAATTTIQEFGGTGGMWGTFTDQTSGMHLVKDITGAMTEGTTAAYLLKAKEDGKLDQLKKIVDVENIVDAEAVKTGFGVSLPPEITGKKEKVQEKNKDPMEPMPWRVFKKSKETMQKAVQMILGQIQSVGWSNRWMKAAEWYTNKTSGNMQFDKQETVRIDEMQRNLSDPSVTQLPIPEGEKRTNLSPEAQRMTAERDATPSWRLTDHNRAEKADNVGLLFQAEKARFASMVEPKEDQFRDKTTGEVKKDDFNRAYQKFETQYEAQLGVVNNLNKVRNHIATTNISDTSYFGAIDSILPGHYRDYNSLVGLGSNANTSAELGKKLWENSSQNKMADSRAAKDFNEKFFGKSAGIDAFYQELHKKFIVDPVTGGYQIPPEEYPKLLKHLEGLQQQQSIGYPPPERSNS